MVQALANERYASAGSGDGEAHQASRRNGAAPRDELAQAEELRRSGEVRQAEAIYRRALAGVAPALHGLGLVAFQCGAGDAALTFLRAACEVAPTTAGHWADYGRGLLACRRFDEAANAFERSLRQGFDEAESQTLLGAAHLGAERARDARAAFERVLELVESSANASNGLGLTGISEGRLSDAAIAFRQSLAIEPGNSEVWNCLAVVLYDQGIAEEGQEALARAEELEPESLDVTTNRLFYANCAPDRSAEDIARLHRDWGGRLVARFENERKPHRNSKNAERRLRVGYVSPDFKQHSVAFFLSPLLAAHDFDAFEIFCYASDRTSDWMTSRLRHLAGAWRDISELDDDAAAALIRGDEIDILVDLAGYTAGARMALFAKKPAPVQVSYLGYPNTTGLRTIDYRVTDAFADPPGVSEKRYVEELVRPFASFLCYEPPPGCPAVAPPPCTVRSRITFGSFNNFRKMNLQTVALWSRILAEVADSRLVLKSKPLDDESCRRRAIGWFEQCGVAPQRIQILPFEPKLTRHLRCYDQVDIALDSFPYNGTTTTCEALWMGVPTVTLVGEDHRSRVGLSLLSNVGLGELAVDNEEDFVAIAAGLAADPSRLLALRGEMRQRLRESPLFDAVAFTRALESAYHDMWRRWCEARQSAPEGLSASDDEKH